MSALHQAGPPGTEPVHEADPSPPPQTTLPIATGGSDTRVIATVSWIVLGLGVIATLLFVREPSVVQHPGLFLLATTGLVGCVSLRILARLLRDRPVD